MRCPPSCTCGLSDRPVFDRIPSPPGVAPGGFSFPAPGRSAQERTVVVVMLAPKNALSFGAGTLLYASIGTALPDYTIVNSIFTGPRGAGGNPPGVPREGQH